MCGIAGIITRNIRTDFCEKGLLVDRLISTRGPDYSGKYEAFIKDKSLNERFLGFWHRRLSIIDLHHVSNQPMTDDLGNVLVFNGEIFNYVELRVELLSLGYAFRTNSDTEVILVAYKHWKEFCFQRFIGMFAIVIYDKNTSTLVFSKDSCGIKPLYYSLNDEALTFSSRVDLTGLLNDESKINLLETHRFLKFGLSDDSSNTLINNVNSILPGEVKIFDIFQMKFVKSLTIDISQATLPSISLDRSMSSAGVLRDILLETLDIHTRSDVGFCTTLSGGIDSTGIIGMLKHLGKNDILPFSYIPNNRSYSEEYWIDLVCKHYGLKAHIIKYEMTDFWNDLDVFLLSNDLPVNSLSMYSQFKVYQGISQTGNKVVLDGQGGDEMFGGYIQYLWYKAVDDITNLDFGDLIKLLNGTSEYLPKNYLIKNILLLFLSKNFKQIAGFVKHSCKDIIINDSFLINGKLDVDFPYLVFTLKEKIDMDTRFVDLPRLLRYADRSSMNWSLESRVPYASQPILSYRNNFSNADYVSNEGVSKNLFREAIKEFLPDKVFKRMDKMGFNTDTSNILFSPRMISLVREILKNVDYPFIHKTNLLAALEGKVEYDHLKLWRIVSFLLWAKERSF